VLLTAVLLELPLLAFLLTLALFLLALLPLVLLLTALLLKLPPLAFLLTLTLLLLALLLLLMPLLLELPPLVLRDLDAASGHWVPQPARAPSPALASGRGSRWHHSPAKWAQGVWARQPSRQSQRQPPRS
jgi:hypothetical protein